MCLGCSTHRKWKLRLELIGEEGKIEQYPYQVEVKTDSASCCGCCQNGVHNLKVNNLRKEDQLFDNMCFPLCCTGGAYEWEEKGHFFRLELPSLYIHEGLYVDGKEISSGRKNTGEWKCQFAIWLLLGLLVIGIGVVFLILSYKLDIWRGFLYLGLSCLATGILTMLPGMIGCCRAQSLSEHYKKMEQQKKIEDNLTTQL